MDRDVGKPIAGTGVELRKGSKTESIRIVFHYRGMRCREALALAHTKTNIAYAVRLRGEILNAIGRGSFSYANYFPDSPNCKIFMEQTDKLPVSIPTVGELLHDYLNLAKRNLALSTFNCYDANTKLHLLPRWESTPVTEVTVRELRSWIKAFTCKRKTLQLILTPFRNTFEQALDDQLIDANPFDVIRLNKILARTQLKSEFKAAPFDIDEIEAILDACDRPQERNMFQLAFSTGMRPSEYIALTWRAVSFREMRVSVEAAFVDGEAKDTAKTDAGLRQIDLRNGALTALQAQTSFTGNGQELVFHNPTYGAQWEGDKPIHRRWRRILKQASVHYRNPYQTRHTFASSLLMLGELPLYVASQMGHTDTTMITTMITRTYGKWIRSGLDDGKRERLLKMYARTGQ